MREHAMKVVQSYRGFDIKYIDFAGWFAVFFPKKNGNMEMTHFNSLKLAQEGIDTHILQENHGQYSMEEFLIHV